MPNLAGHMDAARQSRQPSGFYIGTLNKHYDEGDTVGHAIAKLVVMGAALTFHVAAKSQSSDALIVLTTVGYLTGAADVCKVAVPESNALSAGIALAISKGRYGDQANAHILLNNARQQGIADAGTNKVNCTRVGELVRDQVHSLVGR